MKDGDFFEFETLVEHDAMFCQKHDRARFQLLTKVCLLVDSKQIINIPWKCHSVTLNFLRLNFLSKKECSHFVVSDFMHPH